MARRTKTPTSAATGERPKRRGRPPKQQTDTPNVPGARIIKKYGNRRLYDHTLSRAVTMDELAQAVRKGDDIRVLDGDSGTDITRRILVQIILEEGSRTQLELLPVEFLRQLICLRNEALAKWFERYLNAGAEWMGRTASGGTTSARAIQESLEAFFPWMKGVRSDDNATQADGPPPNPEADLRDEIEDLQRRLAEITTRFTRRPQ